MILPHNDQTNKMIFCETLESMSGFDTCPPNIGFIAHQIDFKPVKAYEEVFLPMHTKMKHFMIPIIIMANKIVAHE